MCRSGTLQSAIPALWLQSATPASALRIRFGTLHQWCVKFLSRIFYLFWAPHCRKLRIGLFDLLATKWCFWPACYQNLGSVLLWCNHGSNFRNLDLERLRTFMPMVPKFSLQDFLPILGGPRLKITNRSFWPLCDRKVLLTDVCQYDM